MAGPQSIDPSKIEWQGSAGRTQTKGEQEEKGRGLNIQESEAKLPYIKPDAEASLEGKKMDLRFKPLAQSEGLRNNFAGNKQVVVYSKSIPELAAALNSAPTPEGDLTLLYTAAKLSDPDSAVREGEQKLWADIMPVIESYATKFGKQVLGGGTFSDESRVRIRRELISRVAAYGSAYDRVRRDYTRTAERYGLPPEDVVGEHAGAPFLPALAKYDQAQILTKRIKANGGTTRPPEEMSNTPQGQPIQGKRFTPEQEADILGQIRSPDFNPETVADTMAGYWATAGGIGPEDVPAYRESVLGNLRELEGLTPEQRAATAGFDYSAVDKMAADNATVGENLVQTGRNIPESAANLIQGVAALPVDAAASLFTGERLGTFKSMTDLATEAVKAAGGSEADTPTIDAFTQVLSDRYGSLDALKQTAITDPIGLAGDVSMIFTGGGTALAKAPGAIGRAGEALATVGRNADPLRAIVELGTEQIPAAAGALPSGLATGARDLATEVAAFPSGIGGAALREAAGAGFDRGRAGAPTVASEAFTENMRRPGSRVEETVRYARDGLANLREQASRAYEAGMQQFGRNPAPLDLTGVQQRLARMRPRNYDAMLGAPNRPSSHVAWDNINNTVQHYEAQAAQNPDLLLPMQVDAFKQDLYDVGSRIGGAYDRDAARVAGEAYNAVKDELVRHDPIYADTMRGYEAASNEVRQLENSFGLAAARGKEPNIESASRRLQSVFRNNANTNYGYRTAQGERLAELDPSGALMPSLAGQTASTWTPRRLQSASVVPLAYLGGPSAIPLLATSSPRLMGEASYGLGRLAGTGARVAEPAVDMGLAGLAKAYDIYSNNPGKALAMTRTGQTAQEIEEERKRELLRRYQLTLPGGDQEAVDFYAGGR